MRRDFYCYAKYITYILLGFGITESGSLSDIARELKNPIQSVKNCVRQNNKLRTFVISRTFCNGYTNGTGVFNGNSGSGVYVFYNGQFYLRGIVSVSLFTSLLKCDVHSISISTDASVFYKWIQSLEIDENGYEIEETMVNCNSNEKFIFMKFLNRIVVRSIEDFL